MATNNKYADITIEPIRPIGEITATDVERQTRSADIDIEVGANSVVAAPVAHKNKHMGVKSRRIISNVIIYIILVAMTVIWLFPFVGILLESFEVTKNGPSSNIWPSKPREGQTIFDNYIKLFTNTEMNFGRWLLNTFVMGLFVAVFQTAFVLMVSYVLSRMRFKGRKGLMNLMLILGMFPGFLSLILIYKVLSSFNLTGEHSIWGLILVYVASSGMGYYVSKGFFDTIPKSLDEAARVDGATRAQVFFKITLPMAKPIVIYTILMGFMAPWGDFMMASYLAHAVDQGKNVAVGLKDMITLTNIGTKYRQFCAGGVVIAIPITILFMCLQKYYVEGVTGGAVKG